MPTLPSTSASGRGNLTTVKRYKDATNHVDTNCVAIDMKIALEQVFL